MIKLTFEIIGALVASSIFALFVGAFFKAASWADAEWSRDDHRWDDW